MSATGSPSATVVGRTTFTQTTDRELVASRTFDAPRTLVWDACTKCDHLPHWYGPRAMTMTSCEIDLCVGGRFRYVVRGPDGMEHGFRGEYLEIVAPERVVNTWEWEPMPGHGSIETATFEEHDGRTTLTVHIRFGSADDFAGWRQSGATSGMTESHDRLEELVARLRAGRA